ncbi:MAG: hypothetical protein DHS20C18_08210 [Saprospiraceae bacterium]|nr:MAG: hypothetical protein DHS20C18_08210 [Saprospiraceae bacterium]
MRLLLTISGIIILGAIFQLFLPWWSLAIVAALLSLLAKLKPLTSFWSGLLAGMLLWGIYAAVLNYTNEGLLATKIGALFGGPAIMVVAMTALFGGITAGLGALSGSLMRS